MHSKRAKRIFQEVTGVPWKSFGNTRWWPQFECYEQILTYTDVQEVLNRINQARFDKGDSATAAVNILKDVRIVVYLKLELAVAVDGAAPFIKKLYLRGIWTTGNGDL